MDLTTFSLAVGLIIALLGFDTMLHPRDVVLEAQVAARVEKIVITEEMLTDILKEEVGRISDTQSVIARPIVQVGRPDGIAISIAEALHVPSVAYAVQSQLGIQPDHIKLRLFAEESTAKILVTGFGSRRFNSFQQEVVQQKDESIVALAHRASVIAIARIDPYITALNLMQRHADDRDFHDCEAIIQYAMAQLPPTPVNAERSRFENLQGIIALFHNDPAVAHTLFHAAMVSDPSNPVPPLNAAFANMALDQDKEAAEHMAELIARNPPTDAALLSTAYMTLAAGRMGSRDAAGAEQAIAQSIAIYPNSSTAHALWSEIKRAAGDQAAAAQLHENALAATKYFENYAEIAALYFRMAWRGGEPVMRSPFGNPPPLNVRGPKSPN